MPGLVAIEDPILNDDPGLRKSGSALRVAAVSKNSTGRLPCFIAAGQGMRRSPGADAQISSQK